MMALTLWQPWASLVAAGAKRYETRSWIPSRNVLKPGDLLAIHAAARPVRLEDFGDEFLDAWCRALKYPPAVSIIGLTMEPRKAVLAVVRYKGYMRIDDRDVGACARVRHFRPQEIRMGDWTPGRYAWELEVVTRFAKPIPAQGRQGLWEWDAPEEALAQVLADAERAGATTQAGETP